DVRVDVHMTGKPSNFSVNGSGNFSSLNVITDIHAHDVFLSGGDCAEDFDVVDVEQLLPGAVVVMDDDGRLAACREAYDTRVAGVVSGAGDHRPGIVLDKRVAENGSGSRMPIALIGKVYCMADASYASIKVGDLLTTSPTPSHAMKAGDSVRALGAVIGKALRPLVAGRGLIPILIVLR